MMPLGPARFFVACLLVCLGGAVRADDDGTDAAAAPPLRASALLQEHYPAIVRESLPIYLSGQRLSGQPGVQTTLEGDARLRRGETLIRAERLQYDIPHDAVQAQGSVHINHAGDIYRGQSLTLDVHTFQGFFTPLHYRFGFNGAYGRAARVDFLDRSHAVIHNATYTTCLRSDLDGSDPLAWEQALTVSPSEWQPDWVLRADTLHLDMETEVGVATGAALQFKGVTVLPVPWLSFPLTDRRKSGLLPPTIGLDERSGIEYTQPYYWNIAPHYDMTLYPVLMARRGAQLGVQGRYLQARHSGELYASTMPGDKLRQRDRWAHSAQQRGSRTWAGSALHWSLNLNRVSDENYWRDFSHDAPALRERLLPSDLNLHWARGRHDVHVRALHWQTLQDAQNPDALIAPPYGMQPHVQWRYTPQALPWGLRGHTLLDSTRFAARRTTGLGNYNNGWRSYWQARAERPFTWPGAHAMARLQLHARHYRLEQPLANGQRSATHVLPTLSLDSGLTFERDSRLFGRALLQTLEPRAFYTYTPYRAQHDLPLYDTARNDFNFTSIYAENEYGGNDRIADNHSLTLGVTTRLLDAASGREAARLDVAQRLRLTDQQVVLPGEVPATSRLSDLLLGGTIQWSDAWDVQASTQYNRDFRRPVRTTAGARYSPGDLRTVSVSYRSQYDTTAAESASRLLDVGWQWPLADWRAAGAADTRRRWYSVGRINYSLKDRKPVDTVIGMEFDGCCWIGRVVLERLQSAINQSNTRLLFQVEFTGFSRLSLGADPQRSLRQNVPRYQQLQRRVQPAGRFARYE